MCLHESVGLSQDGEQTLLCWDCGREFGHLGRDEDETFHAYVDPGKKVVVVPRDGAERQLDKALGVQLNGEGGMFWSQVHECRECRWALACADRTDGEDECHS